MLAKLAKSVLFWTSLGSRAKLDAAPSVGASGCPLASTAPWQANFDPVTLGQGQARSAVAPFARAPFRLALVLVLAPVLLAHWGEAVTGLVLAATALRIAVGRAVQGWAGMVRRRVRACHTAGDQAHAAVVELAATLWAAAASLGLLALGGATVPALARRLALPRAAVAVDVENYLAFEVALLVLWPVLATLVAAADARIGLDRAEAWAGRYNLGHAALALLVPLLGWPPILWPLLSFSLTALGLLALAQVRSRQLLRPGLVGLRGELKRLPTEALRSCWGDPGSAPVITVAVLPFVVVHGSERALLPLALALVAQTVAECISELGSRVEPLTHDTSVYADMHRARWRFKRMTDAAVLLGCGAAMLLGAYGPGLVRGWLGIGAVPRLLTTAMALFVLASAPGGVAARWLSRGGNSAAVAVVLRVDVTLAALLGVLMAATGNDSWAEQALLMVALHAVLAGMVLPGLAARELGIAALPMALGRAWRYTMVALPAALAAFAVSGLRPPRSGREWIIQLAVVGILYLVPGFAAWNLLDGRRGER